MNSIKLNFESTFAGEVSDSDSGQSDSEEEFQDGLDEDLIGDDEDRKRLMQMTEKEREQELFARGERREALRTRYILIFSVFFFGGGYFYFLYPFGLIASLFLSHFMSNHLI